MLLCYPAQFSAAIPPSLRSQIAAILLPRSLTTVRTIMYKQNKTTRSQNCTFEDFEAIIFQPKNWWQKQFKK